MGPYTSPLLVFNPVIIWTFLIRKEVKQMEMEMEIVLDLQKLEVPEEEILFGNSAMSSAVACCNG
jgi:hypothetical protein